MEGQTNKRLATLVGCNYVGTPYELRGCINDVDAVRDTLVARFGFAPADVAVLTDVRGAEVLPTGANIRRALADMVARAAPGDVLFFHYSGHGTLVPPQHGEGGAEKEAIVPSDFNLITDVDFRLLVDRVPPGASFTIVSDSCHSGGLIDQEKEQIGPSVCFDSGAPPTRTARFVPYVALLDHLSAISGMPSSIHIADHLVALFGADASAKFHAHGRSGNGSTLSTALAPASAPTQPRPDEGILLSGCQTNETSADVPSYEASGGKACGAFSSAVQSVLAAHPTPMSNRELVAKARAVLNEVGFEQHPCLYCTDANAEAPFLSQGKEEAAVGAALL
ncbi:metacaspase-9 [Hordeum vulgare subsp. vulgare]|uniref:Peptidase C14 caspase domain-containing protein n=1 Tax=Hordeum vulgare subsp. vulgare TaxID=112509 RepID=M0X658_HORVV|nr:metacaspase-9 [Hordeum vulgare subsp. vulgare]KAI4991762.1 hypothetical protein ZWY2020_040148 [Hordeum vulgare]